MYKHGSDQPSLASTTDASFANDLGPSPRSVWQRCSSSARRRLSSLRRRWMGVPIWKTPVEVAWDWLIRHPDIAGLTNGGACPALAYQHVIVQLGQTELLATLNHVRVEEKSTDVGNGFNSLALQRAIEAQLALRRGDSASGRRLMNDLRRRQHLRRGFRFPLTASQQAALHWQFLGSSLEEVSCAFAQQSESLPTTIHADDGRFQTIEAWLQEFATPGMKIVDVGCGSGRFLKHLCEKFPEIQWFGIDLSEQMLRQLPDGVQACCGSLLQLPAATATFDAAFCVEALEHSLLPRKASEELARILKPNGPLLIIDKNANYQTTSELEPWERWFRPSELINWFEEGNMSTRYVGTLRCGTENQKKLFLEAQFMKNSLDVRNCST